MMFGNDVKTVVVSFTIIFTWRDRRKHQKELVRIEVLCGDI